jgi:phage terminase large subunit
VIPSDIFDETRLMQYRAQPRAMVWELFDVVPDPAQHLVLDRFPTEPRIAMQSCTGAGKTATLAWLAINFLLTRVNPSIGVASVTKAQLESSLWRELQYWIGRSKAGVLDLLFECTSDEIRCRDFPATWRIQARGWKQDADQTQIGNALRGVHADYVAWFLDEAGGMPDAVLPVCEAIFSGEPSEAHIVMAGNPTHLRGPLYTASRNRVDWMVVEITADPDDPRRTPRVSIEHARQQIQAWGRDSPWVIVNIFGRFPPQSLNALIGIDEVEMAMKRWYNQQQIGDAPRILGVDVARYGDDASCLVRRHGIQIYAPVRKRDFNSNQGAGWIAREWEEFNADACFIDDTGGFGAGWVDGLLRVGKAPIGVGFANKAHKSDQYHNKRAEMYFDFVQWIRRGGALPDSPQLKRALVETTYSISKTSGLLILEDKDSIKARMGYSPDEADACALTFAEPITGLGARRPGPVRPRPDEEWNPYKEADLPPMGSFR